VFNLSGGEIIVILVLALIVIGPEKLPDAVRKAGRAYAELRKLSSGFQSELQDNLGEPLRAVQDTVSMMRSDFQSVVNSVAGALDPTTATPNAGTPSADDDKPGASPPSSESATTTGNEPTVDGNGDTAATHGATEPAEASPVAEVLPPAARHVGDEPS
jgi:sec-independent protein translocase protein TatB